MKHSLTFGFIILVTGILSGVSCVHEMPRDLDGTFSQNCSSDTVYFTNDILPLLVSNCATTGCHDSQSHKEGVDVTSYWKLIDSNIVKAGHARKSKLYTCLSASGESQMPPNGNTLSSSDQDLIAKWIDQGAHFNTCLSCDTSLYNFAADIWPIIQNNCTGCHNSNSPGGGFYMQNYTDVKNMVDNGALMGSILGNGYQLMPKNTTGLSTCQINKIQNWISNGAPNN